MRILSGIAVAALSATAAVWSVSAQEGQSPSAAAEAEMQEMLGGAPAEMQIYPESARAAGWELMKQTDLNEDTALPKKTRELIALAVASQIPCNYCIYYHTKAAEAEGATQEEVREAVHVGSLTRHWSTILYGNQYDLEQYKAEVDAAFQ